MEKIFLVAVRRQEETCGDELSQWAYSTMEKAKARLKKEYEKAKVDNDIQEELEEEDAETGDIVCYCHGEVFEMYEMGYYTCWSVNGSISILTIDED